MESKTLLKDLDRAEAAPFIDYPPTPVWYPPLMGAFFAALPAVWFAGHAGHDALAIAVLVVVVGALGAFVWWYRRRWGAWPDMSRAPVEIKGAYRWYGGVLALAFAAMGLIGWLLPAAIAVPVVFVIFTLVFWRYERHVYPQACAQVRRRLA